MYCATSTEHFFDDPDKIVETSLGVSILEDMRQLASYCSKSIFQWDPIQVHEALAEDNDLYYCPYAYGYTNYSRRGYCSHPLKAMDLVTYRGRMLRSVLGGTGLAVSSLCENRETALCGICCLSPDSDHPVYRKRRAARPPQGMARRNQQQYDHEFL